VSRPELHVRSRDVSRVERSESLGQNSMLNIPNELVTSHELTLREDSVSRSYRPVTAGEHVRSQVSPFRIWVSTAPGPPGCIMRPMDTFINHLHTIKITHEFMWLCVPLNTDSHIACRAHAVPLPLTVSGVSFPFDLHSAAVSVSHSPCRAHAMLQPCRFLKATVRDEK
jgi:hypothetical protein